LGSAFGRPKEKGEEVAGLGASVLCASAGLLFAKPKMEPPGLACAGLGFSLFGSAGLEANRPPKGGPEPCFFCGVFVCLAVDFAACLASGLASAAFAFLAAEAASLLAFCLALNSARAALRASASERERERRERAEAWGARREGMRVSVEREGALEGARESEGAREEGEEGEREAREAAR